MSHNYVIQRRTAGPAVHSVCIATVIIQKRHHLLNTQIISRSSLHRFLSNVNKNSAENATLDGWVHTLHSCGHIYRKIGHLHAITTLSPTVALTCQQVSRWFPEVTSCPATGPAVCRLSQCPDRKNTADAFLSKHIISNMLM